MTSNVSRRRVLQLVGTGAASTALVGEAAADQPGEYIIGTGSERARRHARRVAERVDRELDFGDIGQAVAGRFTEAAIDALRKYSDVRYVERDGTVSAVGQSTPWGVDRIDADAAHGDGETGSGADVAILDTGIDSDHPDLQANLGEGYAVETCSGSCDYSWDDDNNHGTHCAGIADAINNSEGVVGVSTEATLHAVKVLDSDGYGSWSGAAEGIQWVADQGYDVGSMSFAGSSGSQTMKDACQYAYDNGVLLVAAAGNTGPCSDCVKYPAAYSTVVAVTASESDDTLADYSCTGPEIEFTAPGTSIYSSIIGGYDTYSGTSMACPHVSGAGAMLMADGYSNAEARDRLATTAENIGLSDSESGAGLLDVEAAVSSSSNSSPSCSIANPSDGETVSGTVTVQVSASDSEDGDDSLNVDISIDGGSWLDAAYSSTSGYYEYDWDSTAVSDGDHTIQARATDSAGATTKSSQITVTVDNTTESSLAVTTGSATNVDTNSVTLNGSLDDLGGASSADVSFDYRETGASSWNATSNQTLSSTGSFSQDVSGLSTGTEYEFRAVANASDGDSDTGSAVTFTADAAAAVSTGDATSVGTNSSTLNGSLDDLGGASSADVYFKYGDAGGSLDSTSSTTTLSSTGSFSIDVSGLSSGTDYDYCAVADTSDGNSDSGSTRTFTTDSSSSGDNAPVIDSYSVTEAGSPNPHAEITADWDVSDTDGDLSSVVVEVFDSSGSLVDSATTWVSGSSGTDADTFKIKHAQNATFDVTVTVTDQSGNSASATQTVSE